MNSFIIILFMSASAFAKPFTGNFKALLTYRTNTKHTEAQMIERKDKKVVKNGFILPSEKILLGSGKLGYIVQSPMVKSGDLKCPQGQYTFELTREGQSKKETGCLGTERFGKLLTAFRDL